ncbi:Coiled-coil and C2 domain-containing protein 1B [Gryganskiella cystojenkinii]|nr:Coiled-coil and C2 domain-containing protein 1B [Gryganskiella cystojenkinii]
MFSWKKQNPPSQQRQQQQQQQSTGDYSDLIAQGMRLANEDIDESGGGDEYMAEDGDDDLGDIDLDDPDLLAELQGLTGDAPAPAPAPPKAKQLTQAPAHSPVKTQSAPKPAPSVSNPAPVSRAAAPQQQQKTSASYVPPTSTGSPALAGLGLDLQGVLGEDDDDDEEVELTEDDWKDPHFLAQLQSLGGSVESQGQGASTSTLKKIEQQTTQTTTTVQLGQPSSPTTVSHPSTIPTPIPGHDHQRAPSGFSKPASASSSMIAIPPRDNDQEMEDSSSVAGAMDIKPQTPIEPKSPKRLEEIPKENDKNLLSLLKTRDVQYKKAALDAKRSGDLTLAAERVKTFKAIQGWIRLVEAGGFLDLELYPIPDAPPAADVHEKDSGSSAPAGTSTSAAPSTSTSIPTVTRPTLGSFSPSIVSPVAEPTTQVSASIAEASAEDMRSGGVVRGGFGGGIEFRPMAADDDFQVVSSSDDDTYDMLQSQLESQIKMCTTTCKHYYQTGDKQTALEFHKLNNIFKRDLLSLQSHRDHKMKAPAFHFQDVRFELEVGFYQEIGLNDLSLEVMRAWDLSHKEIQPSDIDAYVVWDLGWPTENMAGAGSGKGTTPTVKRTARPDFDFTKVLRIERTRTFQKFVERRKVTFEVWHYRGLLWKDYQLGKAQIPLLSLLNHSEIHEIIPLVDPSTRKATGGKLEIKIRLQRPLLKPEIVVKEEKWLVIDEFNSGGLGFPSPVASTPPTRQAASPALGRSGTPASRAGKTSVAVPAAVTRASPSTTLASRGAAAPPRPAGQVIGSSGPVPSASRPTAPRSPAPPAAPASVAPKAQPPSTHPQAHPATTAAVEPVAAVVAEPKESDNEKALSELNNVDLLVSNNVLENEIQLAQKMVHDARAVANSELEEEHQDRLTQLEIKMKLLVLQVQTGQLTMEAYCKAVYARIEKDKQLAITCKRLKMVPEAMRALGRSKIMTQEMKEVEEAMAAQNDDEEDE